MRAPLFHDVLPVGTVVVAAHTVHKFVKTVKEDKSAKGKGKAKEEDKDGLPIVNLSMNLLWVAILAFP